MNNNDNKVMGPMEFAVVRNNYYQIDVNSVKAIGSNRPIDPEFSTPDEMPKSYLEVSVKVLPWIVRKNSIDF
ncbi:hypothetical protein EVA_08930 [gut metagenome]|uniref:Minor fimbrium subunit Mfa1 C-terminal domain-containing protein n=1 Tax=gut metagenome TaxID=749906 RepID=J9GLB4_9ZZZZ